MTVKVKNGTSTVVRLCAKSKSALTSTGGDLSKLVKHCFKCSIAGHTLQLERRPYTAACDGIISITTPHASGGSSNSSIGITMCQCYCTGACSGTQCL